MSEAPPKISASLDPDDPASRFYDHEGTNGNGNGHGNGESNGHHQANGNGHIEQHRPVTAGASPSTEDRDHA